MKTSTQRKIRTYAVKQTGEVLLHDLDKANLVINQFIKSCSHSMRGPLKSIGGLVNLLRDRSKDSELSCDKVLGYIDGSVERMETMLDGLEQFMVNSRREIERKAIEVTPLIQQTVSGFKGEIGNQSIGLMIESKQTVPFCSDPGRIKLILTHLVANAITFQRGDNTDKRIVIRSLVDADTCTFSVQDNGIGIEADQLDNIFNLFHRASSISQGAGIGLFVVREALEKMDGRITVESKPEEGSVFTFTVPNRNRFDISDLGG